MGHVFSLVHIGHFRWNVEKYQSTKSIANGQIYHMVLFQEWIGKKKCENLHKKLSISVPRLFDSLVGNVILE